MKTPREVQFRDLEAKKLTEALDAWADFPDEANESVLREAVANYVHAQSLIKFRIEEARIAANMDSAIVEAEARKRLEAKGLM